MSCTQCWRMSCRMCPACCPPIRGRCAPLLAAAAHAPRRRCSRPLLLPAHATRRSWHLLALPGCGCGACSTCSSPPQIPECERRLGCRPPSLLLIHGIGAAAGQGPSGALAAGVSETLPAGTLPAGLAGFSWRQSVVTLGGWSAPPCFAHARQHWVHLWIHPVLQRPRLLACGHWRLQAAGPLLLPAQLSKHQQPEAGAGWLQGRRINSHVVMRGSGAASRLCDLIC